MFTNIGALIALQLGVDLAVFDAVDFDAVFELVELRLGDVAEGTDAIAPQPAGVGEFERARQSAVIGQEQQAFGIEIQPPHRHHPVSVDHDARVAEHAERTLADRRIVRDEQSDAVDHCRRHDAPTTASTDSESSRTTSIATW